MTALTHRPARQVAFGLAAGAALTAAATVVEPALAQTPIPMPMPDVQPMLEWCRQMMASVDVQAMLDACRAMMGQVGTQMQGMMSQMRGMCMMGR